MLRGTRAKMFAQEIEKPLEILCNIALTQAYTHSPYTTTTTTGIGGMANKIGGMPLGFLDAYFY